MNIDSLPEKTALRRLAPPLAFIFALCLLVVFCYDSSYSSLPPTEKRYVTAKTAMENLKQNDKKNKQREPWEKLATEFRSIYDGDPSWPNRPAVLFRAAETLEELAKRSFARADARKAINCYETLALRHASSRLADDALFRAASMRAAWLKDEKGALALLQRLKKQYPKGDMIGEAAALERALKASAKGQASPEAAAKVARATATSSDDVKDKKRAAEKPPISFAGDLPLRYRAAKSRIASLRADKVKACWRQPWENIRDEFLKISRNSKHRLAPAALYHAALCQQYLATCSRLKADSKKAVEMYLSVASKFPGHAYADDAMLNAARIQRGLPGGGAEAEKILAQLISRFPKGDMLPEAKRLRSIWIAENKPATSAKAKLAAKTPPELQVLSWNSLNKNSVEISLEMSAPANYTTNVVKAGKNSPAKLTIDFDNATVVSDVRKGVSVNGSLLKAVRASEKKGGGASLQFDFRDIADYDVKTSADSSRIIISVVAGKAKLAGKSSKSVAQAPSKSRKGKLDVTRVSNMASQLGLTVHRVFIDPGHGGKDPGTSHNSILERKITLDVAKTLGGLLQANGLEIIYSRSRDKYVALSERTRMANAAGADLFVSIHVNANDDKSIAGFETYYLDLASNTRAARVAMLENATSDRRLGDMQSMLADVMLNAKTDESRRLAGDIQRLSMFRLKKRDFPTRNNGVKSAPFHVLLGARMPAVLVEIGYCTNAADAKNLANPKFLHAVAEGLAEGIMAYKDRLAHNRTASK